MDAYTQYFIICPLLFLGGFVDSIAGGGGLITLPAYLLAGLPPHLALGTNKFTFPPRAWPSTDLSNCGRP